METSELESQVYNALISNENLAGMLPRMTDGSLPVFHLAAPAGDVKRYPVLVYAPISDVPVLFTDDEETFHSVTIRISIVTNDGQYSEIYKIIRQIMTKELDFKRVNAVPKIDFEFDKIILDADFKTMIKS